MRTLTTFVALLLIHTVYSQKVIEIWPNEIPNKIKSVEKEIKFYNNDSSLYSFTKVQKPTLEIFLPPKKSSKRIGLIIMPGGGYKNIAYKWEGITTSNYFNSKGIATFILKYRTPQSKSVNIKHIAPHQDAQRAIKIVRKHAKKWNIDEQKIGVIGYSAGGHLASTLGTQFDLETYEKKDSIDYISARPNFMALIYPVISMNKEIYHNGSAKNLLGSKPSNELIKKYSNELNVDYSTPPTFIVHSNDDKAVDVQNSLIFHQYLNQFNIKNEMHIYQEGGHGYGLAINKGTLSKWPELFYEWLIFLK